MLVEPPPTRLTAIASNINSAQSRPARLRYGIAAGHADRICAMRARTHTHTCDGRGAGGWQLSVRQRDNCIICR